ncbi:hypothetical protein [Streptosporangium sp. NPDC001681]|uniref:hypothetical protein n=1 Tax=Streptosporangium sp. NPDC001681 TaxID=3154395 RepID=UPI00332E3FD9
MRSTTFAVPGDDELVEYLEAIQAADDRAHPYVPAAPLWPGYRDERNPAEQMLTWADNDAYRWGEQNDKGNW